MSPKEYLIRYRNLNSEIDSLCEEVQRLRSLATKATSGRLNPSRKKTRKDAIFVELIPKILFIEDKIDRKTDKLILLREEIERAINSVQDSTLSALLRYRYICCLPWNKVAKKLNYSEDHTKGYLHNKALEKVNTF